MRNIVNSLLLLLLTLNAQAATDTLATAEHNAMLATDRLGRSNNPALMVSLFETSYSEIFADFNYTTANTPRLLQTGDGEAFGRIKADSYVRLSPRTAVWGEASYRTGKRQNIKWCSTADFLLLYPHIMGDTLGGDLSSERYTFAGGWATQLGRLAIGANVDFRAEHEYRTVDPRPRSIVTDLTIMLGATYNVAQYQLGINLGAAFYKQTNTVKFYREDGVIPEYQMVGLGMDYKRFSGSNASAYYKATGWRAGLDVQPASGLGPFLSAGYAYTPYRRILPNYNALPMTTLYLERLEAQAGWRFRIKQAALSLYAEADYEHRSGDEHLAGNATSSEYRVVADLTTYHCHDAEIFLGATAQLPLAGGQASARLEGGLTDYAADYVTPHREMSFAKAFGRMEAQWQSQLGRTWLTAAVNAAYWANTSKSLTLPYASMDAANTLLMDYTYAHLTDSPFTVGARVRFDVPLSVRGLSTVFAQATAQHTTSADYHASHLALAVGLTF